MKHLKQPDPVVKYEPPLVHENAPTSFIAEFVGALFNTKRLPNIVAPPAAPTLAEQARYLAKLWAIGIVLMTLVTVGMVKLDIFDRPGTAVLVYLLVIVVISLMDSFITSAIFSLAAVACLSYFFIVPLYSFQIAHAQDVVALVAFILTSFVITTLVRRARHFGEAQHEQAHLLDLTPDAVLVLDVNRVITYWNRGAERLFGWKKQEAIGKEAQLLLKTKYPAPLDELEQESNRRGYWEGELVQTTRDGEEVFVQSRWVRRLDRRGKPIGTLQSNTDITARKLAEQALLQIEAAYVSEAQRLSHTGSFGWNTTTGELIWSDETFRIFDYDKTTKPNLELALQRVHPDDREAVQHALNNALSERQPLDVEFRLEMPDGTVKNLHIVGQPLAEESDDLKLVGAVMDVTTHRVAYAALENSEMRYRHLFKFMPISLWKLDVHGLVDMFKEVKAAGITDFTAYLTAHPEFVTRAMEVIITEEVNEATLRMFGASSQQELLGPIAPRFQPARATMARILESRFRNEAIFEEQSRLLTVDGRLIDVIVTAARTDGGITLAGVVELTELVRTQQTLEKLQVEFAHAARVSTLGELTASIAHELNQPLGAIVTNCDAGLRWLDRAEPNIDEVRALTRRSLADARRAADIISRVRSMAARRAPERVLVLPQDVVLEALQFLRHEVEWRGVTVSHIFSSEAPHVMADRTLLHQVIVNLAVNAMQAMAQLGTSERRITVRTALHNGRWFRCSVEDSGPGIDPQHLPRLFESFFTTKQGGMGMGLSICQSIIEAHGGRIEAANDSIHGGARFSFTLPAAGGRLQ
ncbi:PAS domain S-box protein [Bradyrhizobium sp. Arg68]|uniref:PAS domain-containing protein n=1 Tax=Bradyrhizobium ivorense TaxID=2511166 RepID=UPI001E38A772|nr:PAS domain-containing protein [Bradyrhizobium ivorense]MCC8935685.1 PAS domain S-box protein [Bradyrhizobium ivorense]